jgi:hypothetical protein
VLGFGVDDPDAARALHVKVVGLVRSGSDVTPELALQTIGSLTVSELCRQADRSSPPGHKDQIDRESGTKGECHEQ